MIKRYLKRSRGMLTLVGVLVAGMVIGGGAVLAFIQGNVTELVSTAQAQEAEAEQGVLIAGVVADSPATEAGLVRGDILLKVNDEAVNTVMELQGALANLEPDAAVTLTVLHGDDERSLSATLGDRDGQAYLGVIPCAGPHTGNYMLRLDEPLKPGANVFADGGKAAVIGVVPDGPADEAGIKRGDVMVMVDEQALDEDNGLAEVIGRYAPGDVVTIEVERDGATESITVTLDEHPEQPDKAFLGVSYGPQIELDRQGMAGPQRFHFFRRMPGQEMPQFDFPERASGQEGVVIHQVAEDSPAAEAGLKNDQIITAVDGEAVSGPRFLVEIIANHAPGDTVTLTITEKDSGDSRDVTVTLGEDPDQTDKAYLGVQIGRVFPFKEEGMPAVPFTDGSL
jgi:S1-C subfamily serine protease